MQNISSDRSIIFSSDCGLIFSSDMDMSSLFIEDAIPKTIGAGDDDEPIINCNSANTFDTGGSLFQSTSTFNSLEVQLPVPKTILKRAKTMPVNKNKKEEELDALLLSTHMRQSKSRGTKTSVSPNRRERSRSSKRRERARSLDEKGDEQQERQRRSGKPRERVRSLNRQDMEHQREQQQLRRHCENLHVAW